MFSSIKSCLPANDSSLIEVSVSTVKEGLVLIFPQL